MLLIQISKLFQNKQHHCTDSCIVTKRKLMLDSSSSIFIFRLNNLLGGRMQTEEVNIRNNGVIAVFLVADLYLVTIWSDTGHTYTRLILTVFKLFSEILLQKVRCLSVCLCDSYSVCHLPSMFCVCLLLVKHY